MSTIQKLAKEWANAEVAALIASTLDLGNTVINTAEEGYVEDALENMAGFDGSFSLKVFEVLVNKEMNAILREIEAKSGNFIL